MNRNPSTILVLRALRIGNIEAATPISKADETANITVIGSNSNTGKNPLGKS